MPAPDQLDTQVPGENPTTPTNTGPDPAELAAVLEANVADIIEGLGALTDDELPVLLQLEAADTGQRRSDLIAAIEAEAASRTAPVAPPPPLQVEPVAPTAVHAGTDGVVRVDEQPYPVLTSAGWVCPEPVPKD